MATVTGEKISVTPAIEKYASKTVGSLERFVDKAQRSSFSADVLVRRVDRAHGNKYEVTVTVKAGGRTISATDSTLNVFAALDIVRVKLAAQL